MQLVKPDKLTLRPLILLQETMSMFDFDIHVRRYP